MARPKKCRKVCSLPRINAFVPKGCDASQKDEVILTVEEYEAIRLIDHQGFTQEECAKYMNIARTTVQQIYFDARKIISTSIVEGRILRIGGGHYRLCEGDGDVYGCEKCRRHHVDGVERGKGEISIMKIAIPVDEKTMETGVCPSFGRAPYFMIYDTDKNDATFIENTAANASGGAGIKAAQFVVDQKPQALLTPRCGQNAGQVITAANIKMYKTIAGTAIENVKFFEKGELAAMTEFHEGFHGKQ